MVYCVGASNGKTIREISRIVNFARSTVQRWTANIFSLDVKRRSGRPAKLTTRAQRQVVREATKDPTLCCSDLCHFTGTNVLCGGMLQPITSPV